MKTKFKLISSLFASSLLLLSCDNSSDTSNDLSVNSSTQKASNLTARIAVSGNILALTYNVAGLPAIISSSSPDVNTAKIGQLIRNYDIVNVQEDFNYHAKLYENDNHPFRTATSGGVPFGDGMNTLSRYSFVDFERVKWNSCNGTDCLTPKGFTFMRLRLKEGVYVDYYNAHPNAGSATADLNARKSNIAQLSDYMKIKSNGNAVILMFDSNCRYTRSGDNIRLLMDNNGLTDAWIKLIRNNNIPALGSPALDCDASNITNTCEEVDKIFYKSNNQITLTASNFSINNPLFVDGAGVPLSDHFPTAVNFAWSQNDLYTASDLFGGPHGDIFSDITLLSATSKVNKIVLRGGNRVDKVSFVLSNGTTLSHGGNGGTEKSLVLNTGEFINSVNMCSGKKDGRTRIFYIEMKTNQNRTIATGTKTSDVFNYIVPAGYQITGFFGRSATEVDQLGFFGVSL